MELNTVETDRRPSTAQIVLAFAAVYVLWGSTYLGIRIAVETLPPLRMAGVRFLIAGGVLIAVARARGAAMPTAREWRSIVLIGTLMFLGGNGGVMLAAKRLPSGLIAVLIATTPLLIALFDPKRVALGVRGGLGLALGVAGVATLVAPGKGAVITTTSGAIGVAWIMVACATWAWGSLLSRRLVLPKVALMSSGGQMIAGGVVMLTLGLLVEGTHLPSPSARSLWAFVYLIVAGSLIGFTSYAWLLRVVRPVLAATYAYVNPVVALLLGWLVIDEPLTPRIGLGTAVVLAAVVLLSVGADRRGASPMEPGDPRDRATG